jgi:hypothetical protein
MGASDGWGKVGILMVALAVLFAGGVAYFIATGGDDDQPDVAAASVAESSSEEAGESAGDTPQAAASEAAASADEAGDEAAAATEVGDEAAAADDGGDEAAAGDEIGAGAFEGATPPTSASGDDKASDGSLLRANGEIDRPAGLVSLSIESEPAGATVIRKRDGVRLGITPYRYEVEPADGRVSFVLQLKGHKSVVVSMPSNQDGVRQVMLLPGKGGAPVPVASAAPASTESAHKRPRAKKPREKTSRAKSAKKSRRRSKAAKPARAKKKTTGTVDYGGSKIPF